MIILLVGVILALTLLISVVGIQVIIILHKVSRQLDCGDKQAGEVAQKIVDKAISISNFGRHIAGKS